MSLGLIVHLTDTGTGERRRDGITNTRNEGDNTLCPVSTVRLPLTDQTLARGQNNCNSIVRHDFCFLYTILTAVVRSENIIMPFLAPDRSSHILLEKYGYYTWPINSPWPVSRHSPFYDNPPISLFYSQLMLKTISPRLGRQSPEPDLCLPATLGPVPAARPRPGLSRSSYSWRQILLRKERILRQLKHANTSSGDSGKSPTSESFSES